jgi:hypothetical protein
MEKRTFNLAYGKPYVTSSGESKKAWIPVGRLTIEPESDYGERISVRLDAVPCDPGFTGLLSAFRHEPRHGSAGKHGDDLNDIAF